MVNDVMSNIEKYQITIIAETFENIENISVVSFENMINNWYACQIRMQANINRHLLVW